jgi:hypothetical protein
MEVYSEDEDLAQSRLGLKRLYKMHGTVGPAKASRDLVISRDHFEAYPNTHPRFWQLLGANFLTRSFLFLGFSLTDPNISQIFRLARLYTPAVKRPHYVVFSGVDANQRKRASLQWPDFARVGVHAVVHHVRTSLGPPRPAPRLRSGPMSSRTSSDVCWPQSLMSV